MGVCDKGEKFKENKSKKEEEPKKNLLTRMSQLLYCIDRVIFLGLNCTSSSIQIEEVK